MHSYNLGEVLQTFIAILFELNTFEESSCITLALSSYFYAHRFIAAKHELSVSTEVAPEEIVFYKFAAIIR